MVVQKLAPKILVLRYYQFFAITLGAIFGRTHIPSSPPHLRRTLARFARRIGDSQWWWGTTKMIFVTQMANYFCYPEINPQSRIAAAEAHRFHQHSVRLPKIQTLWINSKTRHSRMLWCYIIPERQEKARDIFALPHTERMMFYDVLWFRACVPKDATLRLHHVHSTSFS